MELRNKYIGFRISYSNYLKIISSAQKSGVSITDFILSALLPKINMVEIPSDDKYLIEPDYKFKLNVADFNNLKNLNEGKMEDGKIIIKTRNEDTSHLILAAAQERLKKLTKN